MIRLSAAQRWAYAVVAGTVGAFVLVGAAVNAGRSHWRDAGVLLVLAVLFGYLVALQWARFVDPVGEGLRYNNWGVVRTLPWERIQGFDVRRSVATRGPGSWLVVAHLRSLPPVTLRATAQTGSYRSRPSPGEQAARQLAAELEELRRSRRDT